MKKPIKNNYSIERLTIDRLDRDSGMVRIVLVPMKERFFTFNQNKKDIEIQIRKKEDKLELWDLERSQIKKMRISQLIKILNLRDTESNIVSENMVFWILSFPDSKEPMKVFHKTIAARQLAKNLYNQVLRNEGGHYESE